MRIDFDTAGMSRAMEPLRPSLAAPARLRARLGQRRLRMLAALLAACALAAGAWMASGAMRSGIAAAAGANLHYELLAGLGFAVSLAATAFAWRVAFRAVGAGVGRLDACARYGTGSIVNTFLPARLGDGARFGLFARALPAAEGRVLLAAGAVAGIGVSRALVHVVVIGCAAAIGAVPLWPVVVLGALVAAAVPVALVLHRRGSGRIARLVEALAMLARNPRLARSLLGWSAFAVCGRLAAAAAAASALGVHRPLEAALAITAALDVAAALPVTPGGIGMTSGAISLALVGRGVHFPVALAVGLVFHGVETVSCLAFAGGSLALSARTRLVPARFVPAGFVRARLVVRPIVRVAAVAGVLTALALLGASHVFDMS